MRTGRRTFSPLTSGAFYWPHSTEEGALSGLVAGSTVTVLFTFCVSSPFDLLVGLRGLIGTTVAVVGMSSVAEVEDLEFARDVIRTSRPDRSETRSQREAQLVRSQTAVADDHVRGERSTRPLGLSDRSRVEGHRRPRETEGDPYPLYITKARSRSRIDPSIAPSDRYKPRIRSLEAAR